VDFETEAFTYLGDPNVVNYSFAIKATYGVSFSLGESMTGWGYNRGLLGLP
jgi:hypothetical protein